MDIFRECGKQDTPVAIIQNGTTPEEKLVVGSVKDIVFKAEFAGITNPAVIVVGEVVHLHPSQLKEKLQHQITIDLLSKQ
jgi:uroporphyrin-III C-methyltransferase